MSPITAADESASTSSVASPGTPSTATEAVAAADAQGHVDDSLLQLVTFVVGQEEFAIPILSVQEINRMMQITRVPQSPPFIEGVINLRGKIIPVMDLRKRFGQDSLDHSEDARIIVVEVAERVIGFTVDRVKEVLRIPDNIVEPPPSMVCGLDSDYVDGVGKLEDRLLILLNLHRLFGNGGFEQLDAVCDAAGAA